MEIVSVMLIDVACLWLDPRLLGRLRIHPSAQRRHLLEDTNISESRLAEHECEEQRLRAPTTTRTVLWKRNGLYHSWRRIWNQFEEP